MSDILPGATPEGPKRANRRKRRNRPERLWPVTGCASRLEVSLKWREQHLQGLPNGDAVHLEYSDHLILDPQDIVWCVFG